MKEGRGIVEGRERDFQCYGYRETVREKIVQIFILVCLVYSWECSGHSESKEEEHDS